MARRRNILDTLGDPEDETTPAPATPAVADAAQEPAPAPRAPRKRATRATAKVPAQEPAEAQQSDAPADSPAPARQAPKVLTAATTNAKRVGLYLHPDDFRALGLAKLDDGADANARIRAMIALWRHNDRYRAAVDKLARTAPRGGGR